MLEPDPDGVNFPDPDRDLIMVFDTETSDKWDFKGAWNAAHQPDLLQLGYKVFTPKRQVVFEMGVNVNTTSFPTWRGINPDAQRIHGITDDVLRVHGYNPSRVANEFLHWAFKSRIFVAHNLDFDERILMCFLARAGYSPEFIPPGVKVCTMKTTTPICKIPHPKGWAMPKWPSLYEAYSTLVDNRGFKNAHNALGDVNPTSEIFWWLVDNGYFHINTIRDELVVLP